MPDQPPATDPFLRDLITVIKDNLADEDFGVAELAAKVNMSRSNLLRRVKKAADVSASVFIRQVRLDQAQALLREEDLTVSEVAFRVGFNSTSYFIRCYRESFGYTPGEEHKQNPEPAVESSAPTAPRSRIYRYGWMGITALALGVIAWLVLRPSTAPARDYDKTIAVLPFTNDSEDTTNVYFINGLMVSILDNLQKIEDLSVRSRTTVERYRAAQLTIPEIARELDVNYIVEGSGQKRGDQILLSIRLIDARRDQQIWSRRFLRQAGDIFQLQTEVATHIAQSIEALITPEEQARIAAAPTDNLVAYDDYLRGLDLLHEGSREELLAAIDLFEQAIEEDPAFAQAHAYIAITYYFLDAYQAEQPHGEMINTYADRAMLLQPELAEGLIAKALYYLHEQRYEQSIEYFEKVLEYYPHSAWVHNFLTGLYNATLPNTEKYLAHALRSIRLAVAEQDSTNASYTYLNLGNALAQAGFLDEAGPYIRQSLNYNPGNRYSELLTVYLDLDQHHSLDTALTDLRRIYAQDTTWVDVIQELRKLYYFQEDYPAAWRYYQKFLRIKEAYGLDIYPGEDIKIAFVLRQLGRPDEARAFLESYRQFAEENTSIYQSLSIAAYQVMIGESEEAMANLRTFSEQSGYQYWYILFLEDDPILRQLADQPDYQPTIQRIKDRFWAEHRAMRGMLEEEGVL
ncbi:MAG: helix-turn-helix domain-containing protein [Lewinella sp.]|nr:helix-turn-helix domain-containing protein [Lewinella sp.]